VNAVKNRKTNDKHKASATRSDSEDNGEGSVVPVLNKVLENITEVMRWLEH
jgi:hypothetical protein